MDAETRQVMKELADELNNTWSSLVDEWSKHSSYDATEDTKQIKTLIKRARELLEK